MNEKFVSSLVILLMMGVRGLACDGCGCSANHLQGNLLTGFRQHAVGIQYQATRFHGNANHSNALSDNFHSIHMLARYFISKRWYIATSLPYHWNLRNQNETQLKTFGMGDIKLSGHFILADNNHPGKLFSTFWDVGFGVIAPSGKYNPHIRNQSLPENFNPGKGSWGATMQSNLNLNTNGWGLMTQLGLQYSGATKNGYRFGNSASCQSVFYYEAAFNPTRKLLPYAGIYGEWLGEDMHANKHKVNSTGGHGAFATFGCQMVLNNWIAGAGCQIPVAQNFSNGDFIAKTRWNIQIACLLSKI